MAPQDFPLTAIVPAAGSGVRFGANKPFATLGGRPLVLWVLEALESSPHVAEIIPVFKDDDMGAGERLVRGGGFSKIRTLVPGGRERQDSVMNALKLIEDSSCTVLIHDGARPFLDGALIRDTLRGIKGFDGAIAAVPLKDTIKEAAPGGVVAKTLRRDTLWAVQTPQVFPFVTVTEAYERAVSEGYYCTDDASLVERIGGRVGIVMGSYENIKITTPEDMQLAEAILRRRQDEGRLRV